MVRVLDTEGEEMFRVPLGPAAARAFWPGEEPGAAIGRGVKLNGETLTVVGVVADVRHHELVGSIEPYMYLPILQAGWPAFHLVVHLDDGADAKMMSARLVELLLSLDPRLPVAEVQPLEKAADRVLRPFRVAASVVTAAALVGLLVVVVGLYATLSFFVTRGRRSAAIRMAMGAAPGRIVSWVLTSALRPALLGILLGAGLAGALSPLAEPYLFESLPASQVLSDLLVAAIFLAGVVTAAAMLPSMRAAKVDPAEILRAE